jgi:hypothetical protein
MDVEFQLKACAEDARFVLLSKDINTLLAVESLTQAHWDASSGSPGSSGPAFSSVRWKGDTQNGYALCTFNHVRLNSVAFECKDSRIVKHEFK